MEKGLVAADKIWEAIDIPMGANKNNKVKITQRFNLKVKLIYFKSIENSWWLHMVRGPFRDNIECM